MLHLLLHLVLHLLGLDDLLVKVLKSPLSLQPGAEELSALPTTEPGLRVSGLTWSDLTLDLKNII
jgi:hypothetical protein